MLNFKEKCELLYDIKNGVNPSTESWYEDYIENVIFDKYDVQEILPEDTDSLRKWNDIVKKHDKFECYLLVTKDKKFVKVSNIIIAMIKLALGVASEDDEAKIDLFPEFLASMSGKTVDQVESEIGDKIDIDFIKKMIPGDISPEKRDETLKMLMDEEKMDEIISMIINGIKSSSKPALSSVITDIIIDDDVVETVVENGKQSVFSTILDPAEFTIPKDEKNPEEVVKSYNASEEEKTSVKNAFKGRYDAACAHIEKAGGIEKISSGERDNFVILDEIYNNPQKTLLDSKVNAILNLLQNKGVKFRATFSVAEASTKNVMQSAKTIKLINHLGDIISYNEGVDLRYLEIGKNEVVIDLH